MGVYEKVSRSLSVSTTDSALKAEYMVKSANEATALAEVLSETPVVWLGLVRGEVELEEVGLGLWVATVRYLPIEPGEGLGVEPGEPQAPADDDDLGPSFAFQTGGGTRKATQSLNTVSSTRRGGGAAPNHKGAIGVTRDGVEGVEIIVPAPEWEITVKRARINLRYFNALISCTGKVNLAKFWSHSKGEALYLGASGTGNLRDGWSITHRFRSSPNRFNIVVSDEITVPSKEGFEYLWVQYSERMIGGNRCTIPETAYVEQVYEYANFGLLEIGA
jgi:hypothetical protein